LKQLLFLLCVLVFIVACFKEEEKYYTHLYGWVRDPSTPDTNGVDGIVVQIVDINPKDVSRNRIREDTTHTVDSLHGFFEMDSVCYGTSGYMGAQTVMIHIDSTKNPGYPTQWWFPDIGGGVDTVILHIKH